MGEEFGFPSLPPSLSLLWGEEAGKGCFYDVFFLPFALLRFRLDVCVLCANGWETWASAGECDSLAPSRMPHRYDEHGMVTEAIQDDLLCLSELDFSASPSVSRL